MIKLDKKLRLLCRIFAIGFAAALVSMFDGAFSYTAMGSTTTVTAVGSPLKFWFAMLWDGAIFVVSFYFGFIARLKA